MGQIGDASHLAEKVDRLEESLRHMTLRLERAEQHGRRRARLAATAAFGAAMLMFAGGALFVQQVTRLDVIGPNNDVRLAMSVDPITGSAGLEIFGVNGRKMIFLGTSRDGLPNLSMYDPSGLRIIREVAP